MSREGDRVERAAVNSELDHPPERGVPYLDEMNIATATITKVDRTRTRSYSLADMCARGAATEHRALASASVP